MIEDLRVTDKAQVVAGRLRKRIRKLTVQRDHWHERTERLEEIIRVAPYIKRGFEQYEENKRRAERLRELEAVHSPLIHEIEKLRGVCAERDEELKRLRIELKDAIRTAEEGKAIRLSCLMNLYWE